MAYTGSIPTKGIRARRGVWDLDLYDVIETQNDTGEMVISFSSTPFISPSPRAFVFTQGGREFRLAKQNYAELSFLFSIRFVEGVHSRMRVKFRGRDLEILAVENINEMDIELWLYCKEVI